jgi:hypothetical protein
VFSFVLVFQFELVGIRVISIFFEFGGGCIHYNFTADQPADHHSSVGAGSTKLFFSEVDYYFRNENDVLLCCIVGEDDAGIPLVTSVSSNFTVFHTSYCFFLTVHMFPYCL